MENGQKVPRILVRALSYLLVAVLALIVGLKVQPRYKGDFAKLSELAGVIDQYFIGDINETDMMDGAAAGMVSGLGDRWSYYIPASQYDAHVEQMENAYIGIGVTISVENIENGLEVLQVEPNGGARAAGILPGDYLVAVDGQSVIENGVDKSRELIRGKEGTTVEIAITRDGQPMTFQVERKLIQIVVAKGEMLEGNIGIVTIANFDERCAEETIKAIETLLEQGAQALIFDVRNNPGGYKDELVKVLDYLLPEGALFRSIDHNGVEIVDESNEDCLQMPMAVLVNENSFSAAEFFAAALEEYGWAVTVGQHTVGKSYFQTTIQLSDGSAVGLSIGKYCTPNGVSLAEVGGLEPTILVEVDSETAASIYGDLLEPKDDPQIQAAVAALQ